MHLHNHSNFSLIDGHARIIDYLQLAKADGQEAFALTDHGSLGGSIELYQEAKKIDIKPIIGIELYVDAYELRERPYPGHITLLAKNESGYRAIIAVNNLAHRQFYYRPRVTLAQLVSYLENCIVLSGCMSSPVFDWPIADAEMMLKELNKHSAGLFLEAQWHYSEDPEFQAKQNMYLERVAVLRKSLDLPAILTNDCHYAFQHDEIIHQSLIKHSQSKEAGLEFDGEGFYFKNQQIMQEIASALGLPNAIDDAVSIARSCNTIVPEADKINWYVPDITLGKSRETIESLCLPEIWRKAQFESFSEERVRQYEERFEYEMSILGTSPAIMNSYLVAHELISWCNNEHIPAAARGSMAGSLVSYLLGITKEDPVKYRLSFSRAVSPARPTIPDFDIDVSSEGRPRVLEYIAERYQETRPISAYIHYGPKGALRKVIRLEGLHSPMEANVLCRTLPDDWTKEDFSYSPTAKKYIGNAPWWENIPEEYRDWVASYRGLYSTMSVHPSGILLGGPERSLENEVPMSWIASSKVLASQYDMYTLKNIGMFKLDVLGLRALDQLAYMKEVSGVELEDDNYDDPDVLYAFSRGLLSEAFQMDGYAAREVIKQIEGIKTFEDLVAVNALCRPGASQFTPEYRKGSTRLISIYPELEPVLGYTNGLILYQEQVMEIGRVLAGFDDAWQDEIKESIKYFKHENFINKIGPKFLEGCQQTTGHDGQLMLETIVKFAGYAFNRAHAMTYSALAYKMMWYKVHHPAAYYAAVFDDCSDRARLVLESHFFGVKWQPADVNTSHFRTQVQGQTILLGLGAIKGVGPAAFAALSEARPFVSFKDLQDRVQKKRCNTKVQANLINAFACNSLGEKGNYNDFQEAFGFSYQHMDAGISIELAKWEKEQPSLRVAGFVTSMSERTIKSGEHSGSKFARVSVTNPVGKRDCMIWPEIWSKLRRSIYVSKPVRLYGQWPLTKDFNVEGEVTA